MAKIYKTTGEVVEVSPKNGTDFSLEEMQAIVEHKVNGVSYHYIEIIYLPNGKLIDAPINRKATEIFMNAFGAVDVVLGDVLVCNENEVE